MFKSLTNLERISSVSINSKAKMNSDSKSSNTPVIDLQFMNRMPNENNPPRLMIINLVSSPKKYKTHF